MTAATLPDVLDDCFPLNTAISAPLGAGESLGVITILRQITRFRPPLRSGFANRGWSLSLVVEGEVHYEDETGRQADIPQGGTFVRVPGLFHKTVAARDHPLDELVCYMMAPACNHIMQLGLLDQRPLAPALTGKNQTLLAAALGEARQVFAHPSTNLEIFIQCMRLFSILRPSVPESRNSAPLDHARQILANDTSAAIALADVARSVNMSESHLRRLFLQAYGLTPANYRQQERMKHGRDLLMNTYHVNEVADMLGYANPFSFSKAFKAFFGVSPSQVKTSSE